MTWYQKWSLPWNPRAWYMCLHNLNKQVHKKQQKKHCVHCGNCSAQNAQWQWPLVSTGFSYFHVKDKDSLALFSVLYWELSFEQLGFIFHQRFQTPWNNKALALRPCAFISFSVFETSDEILTLIVNMLLQDIVQLTCGTCVQDRLWKSALTWWREP